MIMTAAEFKIVTSLLRCVCRAAAYCALSQYQTANAHLLSFEMYETSTARVYVEDIPCHPGDCWTRFVCISDTHSRKFRIPPGDVLLHAGDLSSWGEFEQLEMTIQWLKSL